jgi:transposase InsO family protein
MSLRREFITFALSHKPSIRVLCRLYGISPKTAYKWIARYRERGDSGLQDLSRRPRSSPRRTAPELETAVLAVRDRHPTWGGRKIQAYLLAQHQDPVPAAATISKILKRHGRIHPDEAAKHRAWKRFEHEAPNALWQMDFKGDFPLHAGGRCYPLTVLDDHSRFAVGLRACGNQRAETVQPALTEVFERYGLPEAMIMDNGSPWGVGGHSLTQFSLWLIRLGITVSFSRPYHPQTLGKDERFHRTLNEDVLRSQLFEDLNHCQRHFDDWREIYNLLRPHEAIGMKPPGMRYRPSTRTLPERLEPIQYGPGAIVRKVQDKGEIYYQGRVYVLGRALRGFPVCLRHCDLDGMINVYFCHQQIAQIDLTTP